MRNLALAAALFLAGCNSTKPSADPPVAANADAIAVTPPPVTTPEPSAAAPAPAPSAPAGQLTLVTAPSQVCMVNNQFMGREQIPIEVDGKTYYGCCEMCKGRLGRDASARVAKDPVSGNAVDKSSAVIAQRPNGDVVYFESTSNFEAYRKL